MTWRTTISDALAARPMQADFQTRIEFRDPVPSAEIERAERFFEVELPDELRSLFVETDGVGDWMKVVHSNGWFLNQWLVWPLDELFDQNLALHLSRGNNLAPFSDFPYLFYATAGVDGVYFGYEKREGKIRADSIATWYSMEDRCELTCMSLAQFLQEWIIGTRKV